MNGDVVKLMGHTKIILRSDQEPAIIDLKKKQVQEYRTGQNGNGRVAGGGFTIGRKH